MKLGDWPRTLQTVLGSEQGHVASPSLRPCFAPLLKLNPQVWGYTPCSIRVPLPESLCHMGAGALPGKQRQSLVPTEILSGGRYWLAQTRFMYPSSRGISRFHSENHRRILLPQTPTPLKSACLEGPSKQSCQKHPENLPGEGSGAPCLCVAVTSQDLEHVLGFSFEPTSRIWPLPSTTAETEDPIPVSGGSQEGTTKSPALAANSNSTHDAEIALACGSLVISFVSNVLIVTDYMLPSPHDICCTAGLIFVLQYEKVTLINAV